MSKQVNIEMNGEEEIEFSASINSDGDVEDLYVGLLIKGAAVDVTSLLTQKQVEYFETQILSEATERYEDSRDEAAQRKFEEMRDAKLD